MILPRVAILQPYVPHYRLALWEGVLQKLEREGVEGRVFWGLDERSRHELEKRSDAAYPSWAQEVRTRAVRLPQRSSSIFMRDLPAAWRKVPLLTEMQAGNGNAWRALRARTPYVTMGHGASGTTEDSRLSSALEVTLNRGAKHALTYTLNGAQWVRTRARLPSSRVSSFDNSTDTSAITSSMANTTPAQTAAELARLGISAEAQIALYVGALDAGKRVGLLVAAAQMVFAANARAHLVVVGDGPRRAQLEELARRTNRVTLLGHARLPDLAALIRASRLIVNPGRVGLVAVDSLAMSLPLLTTLQASHAVEIEYLVPGQQLWQTDATAGAFSKQWLSLLQTQPYIRPVNVPSIERSSAKIAAVLLKLTSGGHPKEMCA